MLKTIVPAIGALLLLTAAAAEPCVVTYAGHETDPLAQRNDKKPPRAVVAHLKSILRGDGNPDCDFGHAEIEIVVAGDNRTATTDLGFKVAVVGGLPPGDLFPVERAIRAAGRPTQSLWLHWAETHQPLDFSIEVSAVDRAGNVGPPSAPIRIRDNRGVQETQSGRPQTLESLPER